MTETPLFADYVKLVALSVRKTPILSGIMVAAIATGIGAFITIVIRTIADLRQRSYLETQR